MVARSDRQRVEDIIRTCARLYVMPYFRMLQDDHIHYKNNDPNNPVTIADQQSEIYLESKLSALIPGSLIVGEENAEATPEILHYLKDPANVVWVLDPIDGTNNFKDGKKTFCIIVALVAHGKTQLAWIYDPCTDTMAFAAKGEGAYINGQKITLDQAAPLHGSKGYARGRNVKGIKNVRIETLRCTGHEYIRLAKSEGVFSVYGYMKPWDHLAGVLLVQEAGGIVRRYTGGTYKPHDAKGGIIAANNEDNWRAVKNHLDSVRSHIQKNMA